MGVNADATLNWVLTMQGGRIGVVGVYAGFCNHYNIGAFMEKGLTMAAGQVRACMPAFFKKLADLQVDNFHELAFTLRLGRLSCGAVCGCLELFVCHQLWG